jgi:hypothetical protein
MRATAGIDGAEAHPDGVLVHHDGVLASAVVAALVEAGIPVERVGPSRRLEDAFLALIAAPLDGSPDTDTSRDTPSAGPDLVTVRGTRDDRQR